MFSHLVNNHSTKAYFHSHGAHRRLSTQLRVPFGLGHMNDVYAAVDWLRERQEQIENRLAGQHLAEGDLVLSDLTSSYVDGQCCPLAKRGKLQVEFGLLCDREGCPVALEVFEGNIVDWSLPPRRSPAAGPRGSRAGRRS